MTRHPAFGVFSLTVAGAVAAVAAVAALAALAALGCGDNARTCGVGTMDLQGVCVPVSTTACGDGTKLDNGQCVVDPATCQAGTVLIADRCVDPTHGLTVDLEESPEPNGLMIATGVEASAAPAGAITLSRPGRPSSSTATSRRSATPTPTASSIPTSTPTRSRSRPRRCW